VRSRSSTILPQFFIGHAGTRRKDDQRGYDKRGLPQPVNKVFGHTELSDDEVRLALHHLL